jgi:regulation of enolase protein 1 (concanavalin A-like superfamily)
VFQFDIIIIRYKTKEKVVTKMRIKKIEAIELIGSDEAVRITTQIKTDFFQEAKVRWYLENGKVFAMCGVDKKYLPKTNE